jgi:hypothetical protein
MQLQLKELAPTTFAFTQRPQLERMVELLLQLHEGTYDVQAKEADQLRKEEEIAARNPRLNLATGRTATLSEVEKNLADKQTKRDTNIEERKSALLQSNPLLAELCCELVTNKSVRLIDFFQPLAVELGLDPGSSLTDALASQVQGIPSSLSTQVSVQQLTSGEVRCANN